jgi:polysaccharide biosynthesis transport protein
MWQRAAFVFRVPRGAPLIMTSNVSATRNGVAGTSEIAAGLSAFVKALRKHWALVVATVLLGAGIALIASKMTQPVYEASTLLEMDPNPNQPLGDKTTLDMGAGAFWDVKEYYESQYRIVTSNRLLSAVVRDLGLAGPAQVHLSDDDLAGILRSRVRVTPVKQSRLLTIEADDTDPKQAARIANAVASTFIDQNLQTAVSASSDAVVWLTGQRDSVRKQLEVDENALHQFKLDNDLPSTSINEASNMLRVEMQEYDEALTHTRTKKEEILARVTELAKVDASDPEELPSTELLASGYLQKLRDEYQEAKKSRDALGASGKGDNHPLVREVATRVEVTKAALLGEVLNIRHGVERDLEVIRHQEAGESSLFEQTRKRAVELNLKEIEYHRLDRSFTENERLYELLLTRTKDADLARMMRVNNIRLVDQATEPHEPIRPRTLVNLAIGTFGGMILGFFLPWLREQLDSTIKTPDDVEETMEITCLGLLPDVAAGENKRPYYARRRRRPLPLAPAASHMELFAHEQPLSGLAEAARSLRTNLMFMNPDRPFRKLLVTSAAPAEGKTTVACSIAIALAQGGQRVCIVDADLRRPRLHRIFDRIGDAGITNVLIGDATIEDVARPTAIKNLWSVPSGPIPPNPGDILHSDRLRKFLEELGERFDRVIIDSPPLVAVTDAAVLSKDVDGTVYVIRAFKTTKQLARQGLRALKDVGAPIAGAVLNAVDFNRRDYYEYYQYYRYKREGYAATGQRESADASPTPLN